MKKLFVLVFTMLLGASLSFAQTGSGSTDTTKDPATTKGKKHHHGHHKGHHKGKKNDPNAGGTTNPK